MTPNTKPEAAEAAAVVPTLKLVPLELRGCARILEKGAGGAVVDTVWYTPYETVHDALLRLADEIAGFAAAPAQPEAVPTIDLDADFWASIKRAASESTWMPPEYMMNDWVADVCSWLRQHPLPAQPEAAAVPTNEANTSAVRIYPPDPGKLPEYWNLSAQDAYEYGHLCGYREASSAAPVQTPPQPDTAALRERLEKAEAALREAQAFVAAFPRPEFGAVGSRDVDVARLQAVWDAARASAELPQPEAAERRDWPAMWALWRSGDGWLPASAGATESDVITKADKAESDAFGSQAGYWRAGGWLPRPLVAMSTPPPVSAVKGQGETT